MVSTSSCALRAFKDGWRLASRPMARCLVHMQSSLLGKMESLEEHDGIDWVRTQHVDLALRRLCRPPTITRCGVTCSGRQARITRSFVPTTHHSLVCACCMWQITTRRVK